MRFLAREEWSALRAAHETAVDALLRDHLERRRRGRKHPVEDFLFEYYSFRPGQLRRWHPGAGVVLQDAPPEAGYTAVEGGVVLDLDAFLARRSATVDFVRSLLTATASRPAQLGCFGLHEWAMVYRSPETRHEWPLRLGGAATDAVVEGRGVRCSHFDAFRFFTSPARPLNVLQPSRETQVQLEQPGCLHATMDLYKWAYKLSPLTPSSLVLECFRLAKNVRELDMRASPYDFAALGYEPVRIETPEGRAEYAATQRGFAERGARLRTALLDVCAHAADVGTIAPM
ncbi:3-methyladenine DNA glycosylase [Cryptosporangium phraense]|uniref:3-methyladenine DNA glycosylase n=1 Tax=Cryptosporangium phraense TaxID=2593070 RepID=A0A545ASL8_9ACTN|nr:3-methyladenine DNA glycosylase [Cryptosporangium phraense]TQS44241.1 3-methyladenine DNA glycosylase [Cryptosporangium phraense]